MNMMLAIGQMLTATAQDWSVAEVHAEPGDGRGDSITTRPR